MSFVVTSRFRSPWPTKDEISIDAMQLSDTSFARNTLESQFFRGGYKPSFGQTINNSAYQTTYSSVSYPFFNIPVYSNPHTYAMEPLSREELERFQKLSNDYEPEVQVRLVGQHYAVLVIDMFDIAGPTSITQAIKSNHLRRVLECRSNLCDQDQCACHLFSGYPLTKLTLLDTLRYASVYANHERRWKLWLAGYETTFPLA
jgi:hypothetical protein